MTSKMVLASCVLVALVAMIECQPAAQPSAQPAAGGGWGPPAWGPAAWGPPAWGPPAWGGIPPWVATAPWMPKWSSCLTVGSTCTGCTTKAVCTKVGAIERSCTDPLLPYCNLGECSATPSAECAPAALVPAVPAQTA